MMCSASQTSKIWQIGTHALNLKGKCWKMALNGEPPAPKVPHGRALKEICLQIFWNILWEGKLWNLGPLIILFTNDDKMLVNSRGIWHVWLSKLPSSQPRTSYKQFNIHQLLHWSFSSSAEPLRLGWHGCHISWHHNLIPLVASGHVFTNEGCNLMQYIFRILNVHDCLQGIPNLHPSNHVQYYKHPKPGRNVLEKSPQRIIYISIKF